MLLAYYRTHNTSPELEEPLTSLPSLPPLGDDEGKVPRIELEYGNEFDMGTVPNHTETTKSVKVFNRGQATLNLRDIKTSCACTQGLIPIGQSIIPPGGEGYFNVTIYPKRITGFYSEKILTIFSNDPKNPALELRVKASVSPEFTMEPPSVDFGEFSKGEKRNQKVIITQKDMKQPLEITHIKEFGVPDEVDNNIRFSIEKISDQEPVQYSITIEVTPSISPGEFTREFFIHSNIERQVPVPIKITGKVNAPYTIEPTFPKPLILIPIKHGEISLTKSIIIHPIESVEVKQISIAPDIFEAKLIPPTGEDKQITIQVLPKTTEKEKFAILNLLINHNGQEYTDVVLLKTVSILN